jgi:tetratricopeptide (TPR) repeat protein
LEEDPQEAEYYIYVGEIYFDQELFEKALEMFEKAEKIEPENTKNLINLWGVYMRKNSYDRASEIAKRLLQKDDRDYFYHLLLGFISRVTGDLPKAIQFFEQAYELSNKKKEIKQIIEAVKDEVKIDGRKTHHPSAAKKGESIERCKREIEKDPQNPMLYKHLGDEYKKMGLNDESLQAYQKYVLLSIRVGPEENQ